MASAVDLPPVEVVDGLDVDGLVALVTQTAALQARAMARLTTIASLACAPRNDGVAKQVERLRSDDPINREGQIRILRPKAAAKKLGISRMTLYRLETEGSIPPRIQLSRKCVGWNENALDEFLRNRSRCPQEDASEA
jgi:prophage regulatory protein